MQHFATDIGMRLAVAQLVDREIALSLDAELLAAGWVALGASVASAGLKRLLILNSHGGNDFKTMIRELGLQFPKMFLCQCNWYQALDQKAWTFGRVIEELCLVHAATNLVSQVDAGEGGLI